MTSGPARHLAFVMTRYRAAMPVLLIAALMPSFSSAATNQELEQALIALKAKVEQLETELKETQVAAKAAPVASAPIQTLDNKVRAIERRLEVSAEDATANRIKTPVVSLGDKGLSIATADGNFELKLRGYLQTDWRVWVSDKAQDDIDTLLVRRARPIIEGTVFKNFYYRIMPDFAGASVSLQDAYAEWRQYSFARLAIGKMKEPIGLERLASGAELDFVERGLPNNLVPNRDFGVLLNGDVFGGVVNYAAGVFNGVPDLGSASGAGDTSDDKDFVGRVFVLPFLNVYGPFQGLGLGVAGSYGAEEGSATSPNVASYLTQGQARFFRYRTTSATATLPASAGGATVSIPASLASTTIADGTRYRIAPQAYWYWKQFGMLGEYVASTQTVAFGAHKDDLVNTAWQITGSWVLTGEDASYKSVKPQVNFDPSSGGWGAFELTTRYGELHIDPDSFPAVTASALGTAFADPRQAASAARSWSVGLNWYFNKNFKLNLNYDETSFDGGGGGTVRTPLDREVERVVLTRFQITY